MKKAFTLLALVLCSPLLVSLFSSCSTQGFVSSVTRADIRQMTMFETLANVGVIEKGNKIVYNDSLTKIAKALFETELNNDKTLPVSESFFSEDSVINNKIQYEIYFIMTCLERNIRPKDIPVPPTVDSILCSRNERFGVLAYNWGFTRSTGNYAGQIAKGIAIGILTMGSYYTVPYKDMTRNGLIIVDAKNHNLAYVATAARESSPLEAKTYQKQLKDLLKKYKK